MQVLFMCIMKTKCLTGLGKQSLPLMRIHQSSGSVGQSKPGVKFKILTSSELIWLLQKLISGQSKCVERQIKCDIITRHTMNLEEHFGFWKKRNENQCLVIYSVVSCIKSLEDQLILQVCTKNTKFWLKLTPCLIRWSNYLPKYKVIT